MASLILTTFDWVPEAPRGYVRDLRVRWALEEAELPCRVVPVQDWCFLPDVVAGDGDVLPARGSEPREEGTVDDLAAGTEGYGGAPEVDGSLFAGRNASSPAR